MSNIGLPASRRAVECVLSLERTWHFSKVHWCEQCLEGVAVAAPGPLALEQGLPVAMSAAY